MESDAEFWNQCYANGKTGWDRGEVHPALDRWMEMEIQKPSSVIVPGCGRGYEVLHLARQGMKVTAIDIAEEPVQQLKMDLANLSPATQVIQKSIFEFQPVQPVDFVYEQTCLCALQPDLRATYERTVFRWLKEGGKLLVLFVHTLDYSLEGPPFHCSLREMKQLFFESRWSWSTQEPVRYDHPSGKLFELATILTRK